MAKKRGASSKPKSTRKAARKTSARRRGRLRKAAAREGARREVPRPRGLPSDLGARAQVDDEGSDLPATGRGTEAPHVGRAVENCGCMQCAVHRQAYPTGFSVRRERSLESLLDGGERTAVRAGSATTDELRDVLE